MAQKILILGAGELGTAIVNALLAHSTFSHTETPLTISIREETLQTLNSNDDADSRIKSLRELQTQGISFVSADLVSDSEQVLTSLFDDYHTVIHAGGMSLPPGTQLRVTNAVLASKAFEYVPWQYGVDYDVIGPEAGLGLFREQYQVRALLRAQSKVKWFIMSCGVFMSFLFEDFWGVVQRDKTGKVSGVQALGGWDHLITASTVEDIARCVAELVFVDKHQRGKPVYIASDSITYDEFADVVEQSLEYAIQRNVWTTKELIEESEREPENKLLKYRVVFSEDKGLAWPVEGTYTAKKGFERTSIASYIESTKVLKTRPT